jgi:hypothetical protein
VEIKTTQAHEQKTVTHFQICGEVIKADVKTLEKTLRKQILDSHLILDLSETESMCAEGFDLLFRFANDINEGSLVGRDGSEREVALLAPPNFDVWQEGLDLVFDGMHDSIEAALDARDFA